MEAGSPHARYAIVDDASGRWEVEFLTVEYDWEASARIAEVNGRPDVARQLRTGRAWAGSDGPCSQPAATPLACARSTPAGSSAGSW